MNPLSEDIKDLLVTAGVGAFAATSGWGIFINTEPDEPSTSITIYDLGGPAPEECFNRVIKPLSRPSVQVRVRGTSYLTAHTKMDDVIAALRRVGPWTASGSVYLDLFQSSVALFLQKDQKNRFIWVVDFHAVKKEA